MKSTLMGGHILIWILWDLGSVWHAISVETCTRQQTCFAATLRSQASEQKPNHTREMVDCMFTVFSNYLFGFCDVLCGHLYYEASLACGNMLLHGLSFARSLHSCTIQRSKAVFDWFPCERKAITGRACIYECVQVWMYSYSEYYVCKYYRAAYSLITYNILNRTWHIHSKFIKLSQVKI